ncbi:MAG TPA: metallophosphoesterase [Thermoanaerobaculia bacterium]|jgi:tetratricopeptide (TPR) repeat protein/predicted MPP superfamily phosphohydrolase|nr:metallophosphoesterase [Thermoanaerobaculia bacterium]
MSLTWLHLSDFHFKATDSYDQQEVSRALVDSVTRYYQWRRRPDIIFATGDIANSGQPSEYERATEFFDALLKAAGLDRKRLFVIPGNHDVDRRLASGLARTLSTQDEADAYFGPSAPHPHLNSKLRAYREWYDKFFEGIRQHPRDSTCGPVESFEAGGVRLGILPINSSLFCQDDYDHEKLFVGRRCLTAALDKLGSLNAALNVALIHHPLSWLSPVERAQVRSRIQSRVDFVLRGHLHETENEGVETAEGWALHFAAGAFGTGGDRIESAMYVRVEDGEAVVWPIRYTERPMPAWVLDAGIFPEEPTSEGRFSVARHLPSNYTGSEPQSSPRAIFAEARLSGIKSNIQPGEQAFVGREGLISTIASVFAMPSRRSQVVVRGISGVGKSELAREYARRKRDRYPGGTFLIDFSTGFPLDLIDVVAAHLELNLDENSSAFARGQRVLHELFESPSLLIYDNVLNEHHLRGWLPPFGVSCHILVTTAMDSGFDNWYEALVKPLSEAEAWEFVKGLGGRGVSEPFGERLIEVAGGLPVQLVPAIKRVALGVRRDRIASITFELGPETLGSFERTLKRLRPEALRFLQAASFFAPRKVPRGEVEDHLQGAFGYSSSALRNAVGQCQDFSLLSGNDLLQMNSLLASYVSGVPFEGGEKEFVLLCRSRTKRFGELARQISTSPPDRVRTTAFLSYPRDVLSWKPIPSQEMPDVDAVAAALLKVELFDDAYHWYGLGIEAYLGSRGTDIDEREPEALLGLSERRHQMGFCLSRLGQFDHAVAQLQGAVDAARLIPSMTPRAFDGLARSLAEMGRCFLQGGSLERARETFDAILAQEIVDHIERNRLAWLKSEIGQWYRGVGEVGLAKDWLERAIEDSRQVRPVDHDQIGYICHQVGLCYTSSKKTDDTVTALGFFEQAIAEFEKGDGAGQINSQHLSISLHQLGCCLANLNRSDEAIGFFERAMGAARKGDPSGQVNQGQLGEILYMLGQAYLDTARNVREALRWFRESVEAKREGDLLGRVDRESLRLSLEAAGSCHRKLGEEGEALRLEAEAAALESSGDPV